MNFNALISKLEPTAQTAIKFLKNSGMRESDILEYFSYCPTTKEKTKHAYLWMIDTLPRKQTQFLKRFAALEVGRIAYSDEDHQRGLKLYGGYLRDRGLLDSNNKLPSFVQDYCLGLWDLNND